MPTALGQLLFIKDEIDDWVEEYDRLSFANKEAEKEYFKSRIELTKKQLDVLLKSKFKT